MHWGRARALQTPPQHKRVQSSQTGQRFRSPVACQNSPERQKQSGLTASPHPTCCTILKIISRSLWLLPHPRIRYYGWGGGVDWAEGAVGACVAVKASAPMNKQILQQILRRKKVSIFLNDTPAPGRPPPPRVLTCKLKADPFKQKKWPGPTAPPPLRPHVPRFVHAGTPLDVTVVGLEDHLWGGRRLGWEKGGAVGMGKGGVVGVGQEGVVGRGTVRVG